MWIWCIVAGPQTNRLTNKNENENTERKGDKNQYRKREAKTDSKKKWIEQNEQANERRNQSVTVFIKLFSIILIRINLNAWGCSAGFVGALARIFRCVHA